MSMQEDGVPRMEFWLGKYGGAAASDNVVKVISYKYPPPPLSLPKLA